MLKLEDIQLACAIKGIVPDMLVTVVSIQWHGSEVIELTYKTSTGKVASNMENEVSYDLKDAHSQHSLGVR